jgi:hypothetical protein
MRLGTNSMPRRLADLFGHLLGVAKQHHGVILQFDCRARYEH